MVSFCWSCSDLIGSESFNKCKIVRFPKPVLNSNKKTEANFMIVSEEKTKNVSIKMFKSEFSALPYMAKHI